MEEIRPLDNVSDGNCEEPEVPNHEPEDIFNQIPAQMGKHFDFVTTNERGHLLLGTSDLSSRYWGGSIWYYEDPFSAPDIEKCVAAQEYMAGVADGVFINDKLAAIGQDGGFVVFIAIEDVDGETKLNKIAEIEDHGAPVSSVVLSCDKKAVITASMDNSLRIWDSETTACKKILNPAHTQEVCGVSCHPKEPQMFMSCSLDGNVLLWDLRIKKPASCVFRDIDNSPTAVAYSHSESDLFVVGTLSGVLRLRDPKMYSDDLFQLEELNRPIRRIVSNEFSSSDKMAACGDETKMVVFDVEREALKIRYMDDKHSDFVRGLTWLSEEHLMSCGWDKNIYHHKIPL